jgi:hypothetical protein
MTPSCRAATRSKSRPWPPREKFNVLPPGDSIRGANVVGLGTTLFDQTQPRGHQPPGLFSSRCALPLSGLLVRDLPVLRQSPPIDQRRLLK